MKDFNTYARELAQFYGISITENSKISKLVSSDMEERYLSFSSDTLNYFGLSTFKYAIDFSKLQSMFNISGEVSTKENGNIESSNSSTNDCTYSLAA